jgi:glycosyltransferase involved in cell wall biosynthesis
VTVVGRVDDDQLRWLYGSCHGLVAASYEDFGLTPVEAAAFGAPTAALRWGGFLDTIIDGHTGCFFDEPTPERIAAAVDQLEQGAWSSATLTGHAEQFRPERFASRIAEVIDEVRRAR